MSRRSFLMDLKAEGALALWHDYRRGDAQDMSGNANHGTLTGNIAPLGKGYQPLLNPGYISVPDDITLRVTEATFVCYTTSMVRGFPTQYQDLFFKRGTVAPFNYEVYLNTTGHLGFYDGGLNTSTVSAIGKQYIALNAKHGEVGEVYYDGLFVEILPGGLLTMSPATTVLSILSGNPTSNQFVRFPIEVAIIVNRKLTATEHAKLYGELAAQDWGQRVL